MNLGLDFKNSFIIIAQILLTCFIKTGQFFKEFDDSALFKLSWPGRSEKVEELFDNYAKKVLGINDAVIVSSIDNEQYLCTLPKSYETSRSHLFEYFGPAPGELVSQLYEQRVCTYRIEIYWTYELCHGQYLLQYHEEKDHTRTKRQDYYLGQYIQPESDSENDNVDYMHPPKRRIDDQMLPYFAVRYTQGSLCDINNKPRQATIFYVCDPNGKNQIYSFDEVSSCEYELVVLTAKLCSHPGFKPEKNEELPVECYPLQDAPKKPTALIVWEKELHWEERASQRTKNLVLPSVPKDIDFNSLKRDSAQFKRTRQQYQQPGSTSFFGKSTNQEAAEKVQPTNQQPMTSSSKTTGTGTLFQTAPPTDESLAESFLSGEYCLYGGQGWWKYEYCHGKHVTQYHEDLDTGLTTRILLGAWNIEEHKQWLKQKPHKKRQKREPDGKIMQISHLYSNGDSCQEIGDQQRRRVEVRLKCKETLYSSNAVSLYLLEPKTCEYILGVESNMFCDALQSVDDDSLFKS